MKYNKIKFKKIYQKMIFNKNNFLNKYYHMTSLFKQINNKIKKIILNKVLLC